MATLEKRVQVLFDPQQYKDLAAAATAEGKSVGAFIRSAVDERLRAEQNSRVAILERLFAQADAAPVVDPISVEDWYREYDDERARMDLP